MYAWFHQRGNLTCSLGLTYIYIASACWIFMRFIQKKNEMMLPAMDLHFTSQRGTPLSEVLARHNGSPWIHLHFAQGSSWHACKAIREYHAPAVPFLVGDPLQESPTIHCYPFILFGKKRQQERNVSCFPRTQHKLPKRHHSNTELINRSMASEHLS